MPDRIEREIEEILSRLDDLPQDAPKGERKPVSILDQRDRRRANQAPPPARTRPSLVSRLNPSTFLVAGAGAVIGGLLLSNVWSPLIWVSFGGVVVFLAAFVGAFFRSPRARQAPQEPGHYWRDRYIEYTPSEASTWSRIKGRFRK
jgi:hypothetical protein